MRKALATACIASVCLLCGCSNTNADNPPTSQQMTSEAITEASPVNEVASNGVIPVANDNWELKLIYAGHIQSKYNYPIENCGGGMWGDDNIPVTTGSEHKDYSLINKFQIFPSGNDETSLKYKSGKSVYTLNANGYFSYENDYHELETDNGGYTRFKDSYSIALDKGKATDYYLRALKLMNMNEGVSLLNENIYEPYHSNPDGIMVTEYKPFNLMCEDEKGYCHNIIIEIDGQKYQELLSLFEEIRQLTDKYNWDGLDDSVKQNVTEESHDAGYIPFPDVPDGW